MTIGVSVSEETATVVPDIQYVDIYIVEPSIAVSVVDERVDISVEQTEVVLSVENDRIDVSVSEEVVQVIISEGTDAPVIAEEDEVYDIEVDTSVTNTTYVGQAVPGTPAAAAAWRIKRITETSTGSSVDWADGAAAFIHSWDDHLTLTYGP
jgi:hypothetical protein